MRSAGGVAIGFAMGLVLVLLGLLPLVFLGDLFTGGGGDASDEPGEAPEKGSTEPLASFLSDETEPQDDAPLRPNVDDPTPYAGADVDPSTVLSPNTADDLPVIGEDVDPDLVLDPVDEPGEDYVPGTGSTLQYLIGRDSDLRTGLAWLGDHASGTVDDLRGDENSLIVMAETGDGEGALDDADGTPVIETDGALHLVDGASGNDAITLGNEATYAFGGAGDDRIEAGSGTAALFGGAGDDTLSGGTAPAFMDGGIGNDTILGGSADDVLFGGAHAEGTAAISDADDISGGDGDDRIMGGFGADTLSGGAGDDVIDHHGRIEQEIAWERHAFAWHLDGSPDALDGGAGNDTLIMDRLDTATGGEGLDTFWVYHDDDGADHVAEVTDFEPGLDLLRISLNPELDHGDLSVGLATTSDGSDTLVSVDGQMVAILRGASGVTVSDLVVDVTPDVFA